MAWKLFLHSSDRRSESGFNLIELLVASALGLIVTSIGLGTFISSKKLVHNDMRRTTLTQNLRASLDIIGINIRLAGENLPASFPAIQIIDGGAGSDELIITRNLRDEVLKLCTAITSGTSDHLQFALAGTTPGCIRSDQVQNFNVWNSYLTYQGGEALAYLYEPSSSTGEFFWFNAIVDDGTTMHLELPPGEDWGADYPVGNTAAYILEQWHFALDGDELVMTPEEQVTERRRVMFGIDDLQIEVQFEDGTVQNTLDDTEDWTTVKFIQVALSGTTTASGKEMERTISSRFFPRNVLSN
jgi:type IV pilus assembly protein PilW